MFAKAEIAKLSLCVEKFLSVVYHVTLEMMHLCDKDHEISATFFDLKRD